MKYYFIDQNSPITVEVSWTILEFQNRQNDLFKFNLFTRHLLFSKNVLRRSLFELHNIRILKMNFWSVESIFFLMYFLILFFRKKPKQVSQSTFQRLRIEWKGKGGYIVGEKTGKALENIIILRKQKC